MLSRRQFLGACVGGLAALGLRTARAADRPGSRLFVYAVIDAGQGSSRGIYEVDPSHGTWRRVLDDGTPTARVSPDGRKVATIVSARQGEQERGVWVGDIEAGTPPEHVTDLVGRPFWSPDGSELIVSGSGSQAVAVRGTYETWRIRADGSDRKRLPVAETDIVLDWSPEGDWLLVNSHRDGAGDDYALNPVYCLHPDGTEERLVTPGGVPRVLHRFTLGGRKVIYFSVDEPKDHNDLWIVDRDGKNARVLVAEREREAPWQGLFSPDGERLAVMFFDRSVLADGKKNNVIRGCRVELTDADGRNPVPVGLPAADRIDLLTWI